jgi:hypothetical protein
LFNTVKYCSKIGQIVSKFYQIFQHLNESFSKPNFVNPEPIEWHITTVYLQINMVKYNADQEITNTHENLQIVQSQFFTDKLIFI